MVVVVGVAAVVAVVVRVVTAVVAGQAAADRAALQRAADAGFSAESYEKTMARRKAELDGEKHVKIPFSRLAQKEPRRRSAASTGQSASAKAANQPAQRAQKETRLFMDVHLG